MAAQDFDADDTAGPEGENFAEEERRRKLIFGSAALVVGIVALLVLLYAFGVTSAG